MQMGIVSFKKIGSLVQSNYRNITFFEGGARQISYSFNLVSVML